MKEFSLCVLLGFTSLCSGADLLLRHSPRPLQAESSGEALDPWETPIEGFFVRSHFDVPAVDPGKWIVTVDGLVDHPLKLSLKDLRKLGERTLHAVLECSGNGRGLQTPQAAGIQWRRGAVGNAAWTGVPLAAVLKRAGIRSGAKFVTLAGADEPTKPSVPGFIRSVPLQKALEPDSLLAWAMNRETLPVLQGGPVRVVLPRWYGQNWMKWLTRITVTDREDQGFFMKKAYRMPKEPLAPGAKWDPATGVPPETLLVQALILSPVAGEAVPPGTLAVKGKTFTGSGTIAKVEISTDGKHWEPARVEAPHADGGWQEFHGTAQGTPGPLTILARATDSAGHVQPLEQTPNPAGYLRNAVEAVTVQVGSERIPEGSTLVDNNCLMCHAREVIESQRLTGPQWEKTVAKMEGFGVSLDPLSRQSLLAYLARFSPALPPAKPTLVNLAWEDSRLRGELPRHRGGDRGSKLFAEHCARCHGAEGAGALGPKVRRLSLSGQEFELTVLRGKRQMPAFAGSLSSRDTADIRSFLGR